MHISINREIFLKALSRVYRIVDRRYVDRALGNILINATKDKLILKATDLEAEICEEIEITESVGVVVQEGDATAGAQMLYDIVRRLPSNVKISLSLDSSKEVVNIRSGSTNYLLKSLSPKDFPEFSKDEWQHNFTIDTVTFKRLINCTYAAISSDHTRYNLNGLCFRIHKEGARSLLHIVGTDSHRLALAMIEAPSGSENMQDIIVPRKAIYEIQKLLAENISEEVKCYLNDSKIGFDFGDTFFSTKLISGVFPEYMRIIPSNNTNILNVYREEFIDSANRVSVVGSEGNRALIFNLAKDSLTLSMDSLTADKAEDNLECDYEGEELQVGFNVKYILEEAAQFIEEKMIFEIRDANSATIVRDGTRQDILYLLMPMRT